MADDKIHLRIPPLFLAGFVAVKLVGTSFAGWSWWWMLCPIVPVLGLLVQHFHL